MNIQQFKSKKQSISKKVDTIQDIEQENKRAYIDITTTILNSLKRSNKDKAKRLLNSLQDNKDGLTTKTIENTKLLLEACDFQNKQLLELKQKSLSENQKKDILELHHKIETIKLDLETLITFLFEKLDLVEELLKLDNIPEEKINALVEQLHKELKGI